MVSICPDVADLDFCSGENYVLDDNYFNCWRVLDCPQVYSSTIFDRANVVREYNLPGLERAQEAANTLLTKYFTTYNLTFPNQPGYNIFQTDLYNLCTNSANTPGVCQAYLSGPNSICKTKTYDEISTDFNFTNWCSCFVPPDQQSKDIYDGPVNAVITSCSPTPTNLEIGNVPCYPLCHRVESIQLYQPETGCKYICNSDVCIISDVSINQTGGTNNTGSVNFTQICPGCTTQNECVCIISSSDLEESIDELGIQSSFNRYCGYNAVCYNVDATGNLVPTDCNNYLESSLDKTLKFSVPWIFIGVVVFVLIIFLLLFSTRNKSKTSTRTEDNVTSKISTNING